MSTMSSEMAPPLDEVMLAMDVVDTLRHRQDLVQRELQGTERERQLIEKLKDIYHQQGIEVPDHILREGVAALDQSRFTYTPPAPSLKVLLALLYVRRDGWGRWVLALFIALLLGIGGYFLVYRPYMAQQQAAAALELSEGLPAQMDALYQAIYEETKVQSAVTRADDLIAKGKAAAKDGDRETATKALRALTDIRDTLRLSYIVRVVNRPGEQSGFWTFPEINTEATNYYIVVEAIDDDGHRLTLPILNEETDQVEDVATWGLRVPEAVYRAVASDKRDDGIIEHNIVGRKQYGFLDIDYSVPVMNGAVTRW